MPQEPKLEITETEDRISNSYVITASKGAELYYFVTRYSPTVSPKSLAVTEDDWTAADNGTQTFTRPKDMSDSDIYLISYKSVKTPDLDDLGDLESNVATIGINSAGDLSGVENVAVDDDTCVEYFNLQGVRVTKPKTSGIYIRRVGINTDKVYIR